MYTYSFNFIPIILKKIFFTILLILSAYTSFSQRYRESRILNNQRVDEKLLHFGFTLALNQMDFSLANSNLNNQGAEQVEFQTGFSVGMIADLRLHKNWCLRFQPGLEFGNRIIKYTSPFVKKKEFTNVESVLVNFPFLFKYKSKRISNYRPYLLGGVNYKLDVQPHKRLKVDENVLIRLENSDVCIEFGVGIDFYLPYFKLASELKMSIGLLDIINHSKDPDSNGFDEYTKSIDRLNSNVVTLSFHFE